MNIIKCIIICLNLFFPPLEDWGHYFNVPWRTQAGSHHPRAGFSPEATWMAPHQRYEQGSQWLFWNLFHSCVMKIFLRKYQLHNRFMKTIQHQVFCVTQEDPHWTFVLVFFRSLRCWKFLQWECMKWRRSTRCSCVSPWENTSFRSAQQHHACSATQTASWRPSKTNWVRETFSIFTAEHQWWDDNADFFFLLCIFEINRDGNKHVNIQFTVLSKQKQAVADWSYKQACRTETNLYTLECVWHIPILVNQILRFYFLLSLTYSVTAVYYQGVLLEFSDTICCLRCLRLFPLRYQGWRDDSWQDVLTNRGGMPRCLCECSNGPDQRQLLCECKWRPYWTL